MFLNLSVEDEVEDYHEHATLQKGTGCTNSEARRGKERPRFTLMINKQKIFTDAGKQVESSGGTEARKGEAGRSGIQNHLISVRAKCSVLNTKNIYLQTLW